MLYQMFYPFKEIHGLLLLLLVFFDKCVYLCLLKESKAVLFRTAYMFDPVCSADKEILHLLMHRAWAIYFSLGMCKMTSMATSDSFTACLATLGLWRSPCSHSHITNTWHLSPKELYSLLFWGIWFVQRESLTLEIIARLHWGISFHCKQFHVLVCFMWTWH